MSKKKTKNKGFTLVELLVVIAIIGILAVVAVPALFRNIEKGKIADVEAEISAYKSATLSYYAETGNLPIHVALEGNRQDLKGYIDDSSNGNYQEDKIGTPIGGYYYLGRATNEVETGKMGEWEFSKVREDGSEETNSKNKLQEYGDAFLILYSAGKGQNDTHQIDPVKISKSGLSKLVKDIGYGNIYYSNVDGGISIAVKIKEK